MGASVCLPLGKGKRLSYASNSLMSPDEKVGVIGGFPSHASQSNVGRSDEPKFFGPATQGLGHYPMFGDDTDAAIGKSVQLAAEQVTVAGAVKNVIRIRPAIAAVAPNAQTASA